MDNKKVKSKTAKVLLIIAGTFSIILGIIGIFLPLLPTTPFLLLAAALYSKSSDKFYNWLISNRLLGSFIKNYRDGKGISFQAKFISLTSLWLVMGATIIYAVEEIWLKIGLLIIAISVTIHLLRFPTYSEKKKIKTGSKENLKESVSR